MRKSLAILFKIILKIPYFKEKYFAFYKYLFKPYNLFAGVKKEIVYRNDTKLQLNIDDWIQQQIYFLNDYEKNEIDFLYNFLKNGDTFIDIGGNIGLFSLNASKLVGNSGKVYAFEAFSENFRQFNNNVKINDFKNIVLEHLAISNQQKTIEILYNEAHQNVGMASSYLQNFTSKEEIKAISLDEYVREKKISKIDLIKIDIEGGEFDAIKGMKNVLENYNPKIILEVNTLTLEYSNHTEQELLDLLNSFGYSQKTILSQDDSSYNAVFEK